MPLVDEILFITSIVLIVVQYQFWVYRRRPMAAPPQVQLALAWAVVKSRPEDLPLDEYISSLRRAFAASIRTGQTVKRLQPHRFWQDECARLRLQLREAQDDLSTLRAQVYEQQADAPLASSGHRPKSFAQDGQPASKRRKSIKATTLETDTQDPVAPAQHKELLTILNTHAKVLSASIGELGFYRTHHDEDPDRLFLILSRAISTTKQVYTALSETEMVGSAITDIDVTTIVDHLRAATRAIVPYLQAYDHLDLLRPDQSLIANIVVGFASVFSVGLEALASITYRRTREQHSVCGTSTAPPATSKRKRASVGTASLERIEVAVRQALIGHLSSLDPSKRHHVNIYEACLYWLVTDLGQVTSTLAGIKTPVGSAFHGSDDAKQYARLHGFHLLAILRTAMERAPRSFRLPASNRRTSLRTPSEDESLELGDRNNLNRNALAQMQRTLVKAILGDASPLDQATACIEEPKAPNLPPAKTTGRAKKTTNDTDADPAEAFQLELFEVLGWEILAYEGKLADFLAEDDE